MASSSTSSTSIRIVCVSDTHGHEQKLASVLPKDFDVLIHAGDFTHFGKEHQAVNFGRWLREDLPKSCVAKIVVNGNHESNADWKRKAREIICGDDPSVHFLRQEGVVVKAKGIELRIFGLEFFWPCHEGNPYLEQITPSERDGLDILITHDPPLHSCDHGAGCPSIRGKINAIRPRLVVCGHIHEAHGTKIEQFPEDGKQMMFVNAAICADCSYMPRNYPTILTWTERRDEQNKKIVDIQQEGR